MNFKNFITELKKRNVLKEALSYIVFSWVLLQAADIIYPVIGWGQGSIRTTLIVLITAFPVWIVFAYVFEWTPSGFKKTDDVAPETSIARSTGKKMNGIIIAGLSLAVLLLAGDRIFNFTGTKTEKISNDKSIAVLAFADMSPDKDQEYFSDGISEEILNLLAKIPDLKVISRTSSFSYKGKEENIQKIGEELHVNHILEGSVRKSGSTFRITTKLINVADGAQLWSETFDRSMESIFKIQDEIAAAVTKHLRIALLGEAIKAKTVSPEAYNLYLQARQVWRQSTALGNTNAQKLIRESIALDSSYAPAWTLLSRILSSEMNNFLTIPATEENIAMAIDAAKKAVILDPDYAEGYAWLSTYQQRNWNFTEANENMKKALSLQPENTDVLGDAASNATFLGHQKESLSLGLKIIQNDPLNYFQYYGLGLTYYWLKDYENAEKYLNIFLLHYPNAGIINSSISLIYLGKGKLDKALEVVEKEPDPFWKLYTMSIVVYARGDTKEANALLKKFIADWENIAWSNIASVYAFRGDRDEAFRWMNLAYDYRDGSILEVLNYPEMENLWGDPRWNAYIDRLGLPQDHGFHMD